jgi:tetratricopeptide (TPR) repeat protein
MGVKSCMSDDELRKEFNMTSEQYNNRGVAWAENGNYDKAIKEFTESIKRFPDIPESYYNRGLAYYYINDNGRAIADFSNVIRLVPDFKDVRNFLGMAYNNRATMYNDSGNLTHAIADWEAALKIDPYNTIYMKNLENAKRPRGR